MHWSHKTCMIKSVSYDCNIYFQEIKKEKRKKNLINYITNCMLSLSSCTGQYLASQEVRMVKKVFKPINQSDIRSITRGGW